MASLATLKEVRKLTHPEMPNYLNYIILGSTEYIVAEAASFIAAQEHDDRWEKYTPTRWCDGRPTVVTRCGAITKVERSEVGVFTQGSYARILLGRIDGELVKWWFDGTVTGCVAHPYDIVAIKEE